MTRGLGDVLSHNICILATFKTCFSASMTIGTTVVSGSPASDVTVTPLRVSTAYNTIRRRLSQAYEMIPSRCGAVWAPHQPTQPLPPAPRVMFPPPQRQQSQQRWWMDTPREWRAALQRRMKTKPLSLNPTVTSAHRLVSFFHCRVGGE